MKDENAQHKEVAMIRISLGIGTFLIVSLGWQAAAPAADDPGDLARQARAIFATKCTNCHGPNLAKPRGRFGYVTDLVRIAANREMVVPGAPDESELWELIKRGEMPPADSPTGPLSVEQKEAIRGWIAAGAPMETAGPPPTDLKSSDNGPQGPPPSSTARMLARLGRMHIVVVHFPIALLIAAAAAEFWSARRDPQRPRPEVRFCINLGALSAAAAATLGWLHARSGYGLEAPLTLELHRWTGTATAIYAIVTALLSERQQRRGVRSSWFRAWLLVGAILVTITGHLGGSLVHGQDFLAGE
jgi:mono/diheme cytochrome c family protein/uncharacterized membrane protein